MNKFLSLLLVCTFNAHADVDIFDQASCAGPTISDERALEILGSSSTARLSDGSDELYYRVRQKLNGKVGQWSAAMQLNYRLNAFIFNNKGRLGFNFIVNNTVVNCRLVTESSLRCDYQNKDSGYLNNWGTGTFIGKITDNCLHLKSATSDDGADHEWAYFLKF